MKNQHTRKIALQHIESIAESRQPSRTPTRPHVTSKTGSHRISRVQSNSRSQPGQASSSELDIILDRFQQCLIDRIDTADSEILDISLRHIFENADILYSALLPEMIQCTLHMIASNTTASAGYDPAPQYWIKSVLQDIEAVLERLEALSQLLITTALTTLEALDRSCSIYGTAHIKKRLQHEDEDEECAEIFTTVERLHSADNTYYQWMQALKLLADRLHGWQEQHQTYPVFTTLLTTQNNIHPALTHIDTTMNLARESIVTIFSAILPEFHTVTCGDDETIAALLLNIMQYTDLLLSYIDTLLEAVRVLIQQDNMDALLQ
jgi:hypothetical protein